MKLLPFLLLAAVMSCRLFGNQAASKPILNFTADEVVRIYAERDKYQMDNIDGRRLSVGGVVETTGQHNGSYFILLKGNGLQSLRCNLKPGSVDLATKAKPSAWAVVIGENQGMSGNYVDLDNCSITDMSKN